MKVIALEEHMFPRDILEGAHLDLGMRASQRAAQLDDLNEGRLRVMDAAGIDIQVLSALGSIVQDLDPAESVTRSRQLNERLASTVTNFQDRFRAFASLPMTNPTTSVDELTRCVEELGFVGAMIHGQTHGIFLDHPSVRPILASTIGLRSRAALRATSGAEVSVACSP